MIDANILRSFGNIVITLLLLRCRTSCNFGHLKRTKKATLRTHIFEYHLEWQKVATDNKQINTLKVAWPRRRLFISLQTYKNVHLGYVVFFCMRIWWTMACDCFATAAVDEVEANQHKHRQSKRVSKQWQSLLCYNEEKQQWKKKWKWRTNMKISKRVWCLHIHWKRTKITATEPNEREREREQN